MSVHPFLEQFDTDSRHPFRIRIETGVVGQGVDAAYRVFAIVQQLVAINPLVNWIDKMGLRLLPQFLALRIEMQ